MAAHDACNALAQLRRIPKPVERLLGQPRADLLVAAVGVAALCVVVEPAVGAAPCDVRLAEVVEERGQPNAQRKPGVGCRLNDLERVLVDGQCVPAALLLEPDRRLELRQEVNEHARVAGEPQRLGRLRPEQQLRQLPHPVGREAASDSLTRDELDARRLLAHLPKRLLVGAQAELRDEPETANEPQRILGEAGRRDGPQRPRLEIVAAMVGIDERPVGEPACHGVHGEVPAGEIVLDGRRGIDDDLEVVPPRPGRHLTARRRQLDAGAHELSHLRVAGMEADADGAAGHDELLRTAVRSERRAQALDVHARNEKVRILGVVPEQVVAHRAADDVCVQPERADILLNLLRRVRSPRSRRAHPTEASRPRPSNARAESNRPQRHRSRSCRRSRPGSAETPSS